MYSNIKDMRIMAFSLYSIYRPLRCKRYHYPQHRRPTNDKNYVVSSTRHPTPHESFKRYQNTKDRTKRKTWRRRQDSNLRTQNVSDNQMMILITPLNHSGTTSLMDRQNGGGFMGCGGCCVVGILRSDYGRVEGFGLFEVMIIVDGGFGNEGSAADAVILFRGQNY